MSFLRNSWYCAGWGYELEEKPRGIRILNQFIVMYRDSQGNFVALSGRCPHRFAPLDQGTVVDDNIVCPYHGLKFSPDGECVRNPHGEGIIPPKTRVDKYMTAERNSA